MKIPKIVVVGSSNTDMVVKSEKLPLPGETVLGADFLMNPGGKGANQAVAVARLGGDVLFVCKTGRDVFGSQAVAHYNREGINTDYVFIDDFKASGVALISVDGQGENSIVVALGANASLCKSDIDKVKAEVINADYVLMQLEIPLDTVGYVTQLAFEHGVKVILNPAPACSLPAELLPRLFMIVPNKSEAEMLSGISIKDWESAKDAARIIHEKGVGLVVITLGEMGALVLEGNRFYQVAAETVTPVDTTAAGDTFCGAVAVALAEGKCLREAVAFANRAAAFSVMRMGAQSSIPFRRQLDDGEK